MKLTYLNQKQAGSVLLAMMLVLVVSASFVLVTKLNSSASQYARQGSSLPVLNEAKAALMGFAVNYPENYPGEGPGFLPCPDKDNDGSADGACALAGPTNFTIGRLPFNNLAGLDKLVDHTGEVLWYAVADNYRNNPKTTPLNSDTPGNFVVDSTTDIVAIIFSPGLALSGQSRLVAGENDVSNYLEDENADGNNNWNNNFVSRATGEFNDTLVTITRQELMQAVEKRVLGDVSQALAAYQTNHSAFPWLSPFADPSASAFRGQIATVQGHLPFHWAADPTAVPNVNPFNTEVSWAWNIDAGTAAFTIVPSDIGVTTVTQDCLENVDCVDPIFGTTATVASDWLGPVTVACTWSDKNTANCTKDWGLRGPVNCDLGCGASDCYRAYYPDYPAVSGTETIFDPDATSFRTRAVTYSGALPTQTWALRIYDYYVGDDPSTACSTTYVGWHQLSGLSFNVATTTGTISTLGIQYDFDVDDGELPLWFVENGWQDLIYTSYASGEPLPGDTTANQDCVSLATNCLSVDADSLITPNIRAVAVSAGVDFSPVASTRPNGTLSDYFEVENSVVDDLFMKDKITAANNDQTRIIATAP